MTSKKSKGRNRKGRPRKGQPHIKHDQFRGKLISSIEDHKRTKRTLRPPLTTLPTDVRFINWVNDGLPDSLWAVLLTGNLEREYYLDIFRSVLVNLNDNAKELKDFFLCHSSQRNLKIGQFRKIFGSICEEKEVQQALSPLLLIESLPDRRHWVKLLPEGDSGKDWTKLAQAVAGCIDHQSEKSTDCRWLRLMTEDVLKKPRILKSQAELHHHVVNYPNSGDLRMVRPFIRAAEIALRDPEFNRAIDVAWCPEFWRECWEKTSCMIPNPEQADPPDRKYLIDELTELYNQLMDHFAATNVTTSIDARHDAAFGILFYMIQLCVHLALTNLSTTASGRIVCRTVVESLIILKFLAKKDDPTIWLQYRKFGSGVAKLSFLKNLRQEDIPAFVDLDELEAYCNEDYWIETVDIQLGSWANSNLREMAKFSGLSDLYDKYYDLLGSYVHSNWLALRDSSFITCMNPLHRFHRVPIPPRYQMADVIEDSCKLINLALDELAHLYPTFKTRVRGHKKRLPRTKHKD